MKIFSPGSIGKVPVPVTVVLLLIGTAEMSTVSMLAGSVSVYVNTPDSNEGDIA